MTKIERLRDRRKMDPGRADTPPDNITNAPKLKDFLPSPPSSAGGFTKPRLSHQLSNNVLDIPDVEDVTLPFEPFQVNSSSLICPTTPSVALPETPDLKVSANKNKSKNKFEMIRSTQKEEKVPPVHKQASFQSGALQGSMVPQGSSVKKGNAIKEKNKQVNASPRDTPLFSTSEFLEAFPKVGSKFRSMSRSPSLPNLKRFNLSVSQLAPLEETIGPVVVDQIRYASPTTGGDSFRSSTFFQLPETPFTDRTVYSDMN